MSDDCAASASGVSVDSHPPHQEPNVDEAQDVAESQELIGDDPGGGRKIIQGIIFLPILRK